MEPRVPCNPKRAAVLEQESVAAAAEGRSDVSDWLHKRAMSYLLGQRGTPGTTDPTPHA